MFYLPVFVTPQNSIFSEMQFDPAKTLKYICSKQSCFMILLILIINFSGKNCNIKKRRKHEIGLKSENARKDCTTRSSLFQLPFSTFTLT